MVNLATFDARKRYKHPEHLTCPGVGCTATEFVSAIAAELRWWPATPLRAWAVSALGHAAGDTAQDHWPPFAERCADMSLLQMRQWAEMRMAAIQKGIREYAEGADSMVVLMGDKEFLPCDDEVRVADLYTCGVHMGEG